MCLTENYGGQQGDEVYFLTLDQANQAVDAACEGWMYTSLSPSKNPGHKNTVYVLLAQQTGVLPINITVSVTYNGGTNCPNPPIDFWYDKTHPEYGETHCYDRLRDIVNGCMLYSLQSLTRPLTDPSTRRYKKRKRFLETRWYFLPRLCYVGDLEDCAIPLIYWSVCNFSSSVLLFGLAELAMNTDGIK